jgi:hypothetical protein
VFFLGSLVGQQALAGAPEPFAEFNSFDFTQAGSIVDLGSGEGSLLPAMLDTTFNVNTMVGAVALSIDVMVAGEMLNLINITNVLIADNLCVNNSSTAQCQLYVDMIGIEPGVIISAGHIATATGTLSANGLAPVTESDSFTVTAVPEPAIFALMAIGFFGVALTRRKRIRQ